MTVWLAAAVLAACASPSQDRPVDAALVDAASRDAALDASPSDSQVIDGSPIDAAPDALSPVDAPVPIDAPLPPADAPVDAPNDPPARLRLISGNLTSGNLQAYQDPGIRIFRGLLPDVAMIQELNFASSSPADLRSFVDQAFGPEFFFARGADSGQIPNGVVSRYPIVATGEWLDSEVANRTFVWARIDIPGPVDLFAISVHLLTSSATERNVEAGELVAHIDALPPDAYVVLGGDFNTGSRTESCLQTLSQVLVTAGPFPVDQANVSETNSSRKNPDDWVLVDGALQGLEIPVAIGANQFAHGFVADTRVYTPIADLAPALASDSGAPSMQHMAVVRDFLLPGGPSGSTPSIRVVSPNGGESWTASASQTIRWVASGVADVRVELSLDGTTWTTLAASTPAAAGQLVVTAPAATSSAARIRVTAVPAGTPSDVSDAAFAISFGPPAPDQVFINEVLANEPGSDTAGEFVELVNSGGNDANLAGWTISDATAVRHVFAAGTVLRAGRAIVVYAGAAGIPPGLTNAIAASTGSLVLGNSGDTVSLASTSGTVDSVTYSSALSGTDGVSMNRSPDATAGAPFVLHTALAAQAAQRSPGTRFDGTAF